MPHRTLRGPLNSQDYEVGLEYYDAGRIDGDAGQLTIAAATVADFAAIVLLSLTFSTTGGTVTGRIGSLGVFVALVVLTGVVIGLAGRSRRLGDVLSRLQDTTAEIRVRAAVVLLVAFVALAEQFGLESILGAFLAGVVVSLIDRDASSHPRFRIKFEAIGYGFLIPVFFITSGLRLDLGGLLADVAALARVPLFLLALLLARGLPALLHLRSLGRRDVLAVALLQATSFAVHRDGDADRRGRGSDDTRHRRRAHLRGPAVRPVVPGRCGESVRTRRTALHSPRVVLLPSVVDRKIPAFR